jgi:hypothetical protein
VRINFNSYGLGICGGNRFILELSDSLIDLGHKVTITNLGTSREYSWYPSPKAEIHNLNFARNTLLRAFRKYYLRSRGYDYDKDLLLQNSIPDCDINIATWCLTTYPTLFSHKGKPFYLVQAYEPDFFPEDRVFQEKSTLTYSLPMGRLCVSQWLTKKVNGTYIGNGVNLAKFKNLKLERPFDVMIIPRKQATKGDYESAIQQLENNGLKLLVTRNYSLSEQQLIEAYNSSKTFLYLSETEGFGYPPLEAMACGCAVVTTPCVEFAKHMENAYVVSETKEIRQTIDGILKDEKLRSGLVENGFKTAQEYDFQKVVGRFLESTIKSLLNA